MIPNDLGGQMVGFGKNRRAPLQGDQAQKHLEVGSREWKDTSFGVGSLKSWRLEEAAEPGEDCMGS